MRKAAVPAATGGRKKRKMIVRRKRTLDPAVLVDYKNPDLLRRFITERGRIIPRRISGASQEQQRKITLAVKRARFLGLLPAAISHEVERGFAGEMQAAAQVYMTSARPRPLRPGERSDRPMGDRPERSDRPMGDRPERSDRPMGDRPERSDRPMGDRPMGMSQERTERPARPADAAAPAPFKKGE